MVIGLYLNETGCFVMSRQTEVTKDTMMLGQKMEGV
jgi:hypothetical protein